MLCKAFLSVLIGMSTVAHAQDSTNVGQGTYLDCYMKSVTREDGNTRALWTYAISNDAKRLRTLGFSGGACHLTNWSPAEAAEELCQLSDNIKEDTKTDLTTELGITPAAICEIARRAAQ